jgi:hypothetical protein
MESEMTFLDSVMLMGLMSALIPSSGVAADAGSPLLGRWEIDLEHSEIPPEARPQSVTITYSDAGKGRWSTDVAIVGSDGGKIDATSTYPLDGTLAPGTGYFNVDSVAVRVPRPTVMVTAFYKAGVPRSTRTYIVSPDGSTMLENIVWFGENGKPEIATNQFRRVK